MKILLIGDCAGIHSTLASGLRSLGHEVCVASDGNGWKNYPRDISLTRKNDSYFEGLMCLLRILKNVHKFKGFDVVQITHCPFVRLRSEKTLPLFRYLKRHNGRVFMGAFGTDHYYVKTCMQTDTFRYSDFKVGNRILPIKANEADLKECLQGGTVHANQEIANAVDGIIACLWEYYVSYHPYFPDKTTFIPLPFNIHSVQSRVRDVPNRLNFFIGIQSARNEIKGTNVMYPILQQVALEYPEECRISKAVDVPFAEYGKLLDDADVQLDQLYSYTPSMNSLLAMAKGVTVVGGGEPENYEILGEKELRPIINVIPSEEDIYQKLVMLIKQRSSIPDLSRQSIEYVQRYHDHIKVAVQYLSFWESRM